MNYLDIVPNLNEICLEDMVLSQFWLFFQYFLCNTEQINEFETVPYCPDNFHSNWEQYPGNLRFDLKTDIAFELQKLYMRGKGFKKKE